MEALEAANMTTLSASNDDKVVSTTAFLLQNISWRTMVGLYIETPSYQFKYFHEKDKMIPVTIFCLL